METQFAAIDALQINEKGKNLMENSVNLDVMQQIQWVLTAL